MCYCFFFTLASAADVLCHLSCWITQCSLAGQKTNTFLAAVTNDMHI